MELIKIGQLLIASIGMINSFIVALFLLFVNKGNKKANKLLAILSLAIFLKLSYALILYLPQGWEHVTKYLYYPSESGYIFFGPLLFLYFKVLLKQEINYWKAYSIFIPAILPFLGYLIHFDIPLWAMQLYFLIFLIATFIKLKDTITKKTSNRLLPSEIFWIKTIFASFTLIWLTVNLLFINFELYFFELTAIIAVLFYLDTYLIIKQYWLQKGDQFEPQKYVNSTLSTNEENEIITRLQRVMINDKLYTDSEMSLPKVAEKINIKPYKLSQVINKRMNMTFNEYINSYRIEDIKTIIKDPEHQEIKIASLAFDYGFNSISAFNTAFKKVTNCTPSQYRNENILGNLN